jgi:hypothetical protein
MAAAECGRRIRRVAKASRCGQIRRGSTKRKSAPIVRTTYARPRKNLEMSNILERMRIHSPLAHRGADG